MTKSGLLLPGSFIEPSSLPTPTKSKSLTLGPGLRHIPPSTFLTTTPGTLHVDSRKAALWLEDTPACSPRYIPSVGDLVIAQIHHSSAGDVYFCSLSAHTNHVTLGQLSFEGASKKTRPKLDSGDLVYARVKSGESDQESEIECVDSNTGKSGGMGPLRGGMVFNVSTGFARRLIMGKKEKSGLCLLDAVGERIRFEVAVGRNGKIWIDADSVRDIVGIGACLVGTDELGWNMERQEEEVAKVFSR